MGKTKNKNEGKTEIVIQNQLKLIHASNSNLSPIDYLILL